MRPLNIEQQQQQWKHTTTLNLYSFLYTILGNFAYFVFFIVGKSNSVPLNSLF